MFTGNSYNYESFNRDVIRRDLNRASMRGPKPGDRAPDFQLTSLNGEKVRLSDFRDRKPLVLTFGSLTCPMTAGSVQGMNELYEEFDAGDVAFLFVYVREAHPGEKVPAHSSLRAKTRAARKLRDEEEIQMPILIDDLQGSVHRKYGMMPNPVYIIDRSGKVAFRGWWTRPNLVEDALQALLEPQSSNADPENSIVSGGEDRSVPLHYGVLFAHRSLRRGGKKSLREFREVMGGKGRFALATSRVAGPIAMNPGRSLAGAALAAGVLAGAIYGGLKLRERRLGMRLPYYFPRVRSREKTTGGYEAVGI